jgi:hypothetical protein
MKKSITIIILIFLILLGGIGYYLYINSGSKTIDSGKIFENVKNFFPFGNPQAPSQPTIPIVGTTTELKNKEEVKIDRMFQISEAPVAGFTTFDIISTSTEFFFNKEKNATTSTTTKQTETYVRFMERSTGHIIETKISNLEKVKISNETIPKVYEAYFNSKGSEFITRTLSGDDINTEYRKIFSGTTTTLSKPLPYPYNTDIVIAKGDSIFYTTKTSMGSVGYISNFENKTPLKVLDTPLRDIGASWDGGNLVEIFSKPNSEQLGVSFVVDTKKKSIKENTLNMFGLTTNINSSSTLSLYNTNIVDLSLGAKVLYKGSAFYLKAKTLPEKCVWSKKNSKLAYCVVPNYPDKLKLPEKWYQGVTSFNDDFWSINVETGSENPIYRPSEDGKPQPDAINLSLSTKENYLFFVNKKDLTLWGVSL